MDCLSTGELRVLSSVCSLYASYAESRARAQELRLAGDIEAALAFERCCDATYRKLPEWAKW